MHLDVSAFLRFSTNQPIAGWSFSGPSGSRASSSIESHDLGRSVCFYPTPPYADLYIKAIPYLADLLRDYLRTICTPRFLDLGSRKPGFVSNNSRLQAYVVVVHLSIDRLGTMMPALAIQYHAAVILFHILRKPCPRGNSTGYSR